MFELFKDETINVKKVYVEYLEPQVEDNLIPINMDNFDTQLEDGQIYLMEMEHNDVNEDFVNFAVNGSLSVKFETEEAEEDEEMQEFATKITEEYKESFAKNNVGQAVLMTVEDGYLVHINEKDIRMNDEKILQLYQYYIDGGFTIDDAVYATNM